MASFPLSGYVVNSKNDLLGIENSNSGVDSTIRYVVTGNGNTSALGISTSGVNINGTFSVGGVSFPVIATLVTLTGTQTLTNKTLTAPTINAATLTGTLAGGTFTGSTLTAPTINAATFTGTLDGGTFTNSTMTSPTLNDPTLTSAQLGTPDSGTLTNCTGYTVANLSGLGANVATMLATFSSSNIRAACSDETGTGSLVFANTPTLVTPILGTITSGNLAAGTGYLVESLADDAWTDISSTVTVTGWSGVTLKLVREKVIGKTVFLYINLVGTSNSTGFTLTSLPNAPAYSQNHLSLVTNGGTNGSGIIQLTGASTTITFYSTVASAVWNSAGVKSIYGTITYEIA